MRMLTVTSGSIRLDLDAHAAGTLPSGRKPAHRTLGRSRALPAPRDTRMVDRPPDGHGGEGRGLEQQGVLRRIGAGPG